MTHTYVAHNYFSPMEVCDWCLAQVALDQLLCHVYFLHILQRHRHIASLRRDSSTRRRFAKARLGWDFCYRLAYSLQRLCAGGRIFRRSRDWRVIFGILVRLCILKVQYDSEDWHGALQTEAGKHLCKGIGVIVEDPLMVWSNTKVWNFAVIQQAGHSSKTLVFLIISTWRLHSAFFWCKIICLVQIWLVQPTKTKCFWNQMRAHTTEFEPHELCSAFCGQQVYIIWWWRFFNLICRLQQTLYRCCPCLQQSTDSNVMNWVTVGRQLPL